MRSTGSDAPQGSNEAVPTLRSPWLLIVMASVVVAFSFIGGSGDQELDVAIAVIGKSADRQLVVGTHVHGAGAEGYIGPKGGISVYDLDDLTIVCRIPQSVRALNLLDGDLLLADEQAVSVHRDFDGTVDSLSEPERSIPLKQCGIVPFIVGRQGNKIRLVGLSTEEPEKLFSVRTAFGGWKRELLFTHADKKGPDAIAFWSGERPGLVWSATRDGVSSLHIHFDSSTSGSAVTATHRLRDTERVERILSLHHEGADHLVAICQQEDGVRLVAWRVELVERSPVDQSSLRLTRQSEEPIEWEGAGAIVSLGHANGARPSRLIVVSDAGTLHFDVSVANGALQFAPIEGAQLDFRPAFLSKMIFRVFSLLAVLALVGSAAVIRRRRPVGDLTLRGAPFLKRMLAAGIDFFLGYLISVAGFMVFGVSSLVKTQLRRSLDGESASGIGGFEEIELSQGGWVFLAALYFLNVVGGAWLESRFGWTPGKYMLRLRVVDDIGRGGISLWRAIARRLILFVDLSFLAIVLMFLSGRRQRLGDLAASAMVVERETEETLSSGQQETR